MTLFLKFLWRLFFNFATLVTGGVIGLYYIFVAPSLAALQFRIILDIGIPFLGFLAACFLTWKDLYDENQELHKKVAKLEDDQPKYKLKVTNEAHILDDVLDELKADRAAAEKKKAKAPKPSAWGIQLPTIIGGELTENDWADYIEELDQFKAHIEEMKTIEGYRIINFEVSNHGRVDRNLNVTIRFENCEQIVDFYDEQIRWKRPDKPSRNPLMASLPNVRPAEKLGSRREVHEEEKDLLSVEYDIMRGGDKFQLHYNPIFVRSTSDDPMQVVYTFKSDKLVQTPDKVLQIN